MIGFWEGGRESLESGAKKEHEKRLLELKEKLDNAKSANDVRIVENEIALEEIRYRAEVKRIRRLIF
ncbi:hypothetical protein K2X85_15545 [bacterium]|nr:hypothetical protein [bacterium]